MRIRNYSERTIKSYLGALHGVCSYLKLPPGRITSAQLKAYLYYLADTMHRSTGMLNQTISAWKILQEDILGRKWEEVLIKRPRSKKKLPTVLSRQEALALIHALDNLKHKAIITLAYATGMRRNELLELRPQDIDRHRKVIRVRGKGEKQREVFLSDPLLKLLEDYYRQYQPVCFLFEGHQKGSRYGERTVEVIVKNAAEKAGINKRVTPHVLRHSFATHMLEKGVNLRRLQMLMGHNSMQTTSVYLHLADTEHSSLPDLILEKE